MFVSVIIKKGLTTGESVNVNQNMTAGPKENKG